MAILTREDVYNKMLKEKRPVCPHCKQEMVIWECPPMTFSDGLGWGTPYLFACFNNDCPLYLEGWKNIYEEYGNVASYRCICYPDSGKMECMPVFSREGGTGGLIDEEIKAKEEAEKAAVKKGLEDLQGYYEAGDAGAILKILLHKDTLPPVGLKAAEMIGEVGGLDVIEPLRSQVFENDPVKAQVETSIESIHERNYTKECPFCAEIVKARAIVCKHCGKDLPEKKTE
ncbi:MAG: zinc ribbon domain-containing protein [Desulfobacteria bacterium]